MRINRETDYALRIMRCLARSGEFTGASAVAEQTDVPARFTQKILRKLSQGGLVRSRKGAAGGYCLSRPASEINMLQIIEVIDGPISIFDCTSGEFVCPNPAQDGCSCVYNHTFGELSELISKKLRGVTLDTVV